MPVLDNPKHELFAQSIAKGMSQREAYRAAGYASKSDAAADANAARLISGDRVAARVVELQERAATHTVTTVESLLEAGWSILNAAKTGEDFGAASQTLERLAKIAGHWTDRSKVEASVTTHEQALDALD